ncbi:MAG: hypothetical protein IJZ82_02200 [Lachnospiraceae bacterium]|nr:hypothetical protein [Lachnospiraceae bacterium]
MRRSRIEIAKELIITQMNHWFYISIALTALCLFNSTEPYMLLCICMGILPVYGFVLREKIKVFPLFLLLSVGPAVVFFILPLRDSYAKALMVVFAIVYAVYSIYLRTKTEKGLEAAISPVVAFCVSGGLFILQNSQREVPWDRYYILAAVVYFAGFLIQYFLTHFLTFITVNDSSASNIPERAIFETGIKQTILFTVAVTVFLALVGNIDWLASLLGQIKSVIVEFISKYLQFTPEQGADLSYIGTRLETGAGGFFDNPPEPALIWVILQYVAIVAVMGGLIAVACYAVIKGYQVLSKGFNKVQKGKEQRLAENDDIHEQVEILRKEREKGKNIFDAFTITERIRKVYRKRMEKERFTLVKDGDLHSLSYLTAKESCERINAQGLMLAYEKARYSNANCTNEDLKAAKN